ncbi:hypothetical protein HDV02_000884 [Globomyces sp. JEL0801]|nr:hypothetical protein HDV02_000884 [Globomyces sp. JEL0801]
MESDKIINGVFFLSLALGLHNLYICVTAAIAKSIRINIIQSIASLFQLINQIWFILFFNVDFRGFLDSQCDFYGDLELGCFIIFQMLSFGVLIFRMTCLIPVKYRHVVRISLFVLLVVDMGFSIHSNMNRTTTLNEFGNCVFIYQKFSNQIHTAIKIGLYVLLFVLFLVPASHYYDNTSFQSTKDAFRPVMISISSRVGVAIIGLVICLILSFAEVWGMYYYVEYSIENYLAITASTYEIKLERDTDKNKKSSEFVTEPPPAETQNENTT